MLERLKAYVNGWTAQDIGYDRIVTLRKEFYLVTPQVKQELATLPREPQAAGLFLGRLKKDFEPSLALIQLIGPLTAKKITVDDKLAWLFVCGRDLFTKQLDIPPELKNERELIIQNSEGIILGLAKKASMKGQQLYKPIMDLGLYLRREKTR